MAKEYLIRKMSSDDIYNNEPYLQKYIDYFSKNLRYQYSGFFVNNNITYLVLEREIDIYEKKR